jgi:hypothetical protein
VTAVKKKPSQFIEVPYRELTDAVSLVRPHVGKDDTLPMLMGIRFESHNGVLTLAATDRYSLAVAHVTQSDKELAPFGEFSALIPLRELARVLSIFKPQRGVARFSNPLRITVNGERVEFTQLADSSDLAGSTLSVRTIASHFPPVESIFKPMLSELGTATERVPHSSFNPRILGPVLDAIYRVSDTQVVIRQLTPNKPLLITAALSDYLELIVAVMPVKLSDAPDLAAWQARYPHTPEPVKEPEPTPAIPVRKRAAKPAATTPVARKPRAKNAVSA